jgi:chemotaxis protein histidine kinase CheA
MAADNELETKMETKFGKALYAILCAASPKLAADAALKPMVIGLTRKQCDLRALEPKLLAMDAELRKPETLAAMQAAKDAESEEETEAEKKAREEKAAKDKKAKDGKTAKDLSFEEWAKEEEGESGHKAKDGEEETLEEKKKRYEREKRRADDSEEESEEERKERMEKRKAADKKAKDCSAKDSKEEEKKKAEDGMKKAMDEFKADLRSADEARRAVRPVVGDVLAQDSAEGIYTFALDQMKVDHKDVSGVPALRALFNLAHQASKPAPRVAFDAVSVEEKFTGAGRQIQVM